ncbi:TetR/AcrR family transcriptional regulator [Staphylococcus delphini]|uniref:TetR family transcriptional regulator n=1 Tax=Staphylococcus delphini TaxID=53344 RepID=A0AAX0QY34_9STAP|nr:TetR/AcrR family transcriptional regulator [Staphylococcus delphini]PCF52737.1 TetR family transcriptional regulator [Staphylococcus delphini]PNZ96213.1 TetR/AcrR family transcriptional regulator [Staphylococcus delphini]RIZ56406.1 TetR family transcriptional regulator [Staphylococcus delphini]VED61541.1 bacterial regulatory s, tetR family protein [Staphylococcus delphini]
MYTRKTELTKKHIQEALVRLLKEQEFERITINQIVENAEITRSTFYRYYEDKFELLAEIEDNILNKVRVERRRIEAHYASIDMLNIEVFKWIFVALEDDAETIHALLSYNGPVSFEMKLKRELTKRFADFKGLKKESKVRNALIKEYMYAILIQSLQYWSKHPNDIDEIAKTIRDVQLKGIRKAIHLD